MVRLSDFLRAEFVLVTLDVSTRDDAIAALIDVLPLPEVGQAGRQNLKAAILAREAAGSTGLGGGIAIPHARSPIVAKPILAAGRTAQPIDFHSADGKPVTLIFLLVTPASDAGAHLKVLAAVSRIASDKKLLRGLNKAASPAEFYGLIAQSPV